jgi:hypothetical protein
MLFLSLMWLLALDQAIHVPARRDVLQFMNLPCFTEGDVPRSITGIICLSIQESVNERMARPALYL